MGWLWGNSAKQDKQKQQTERAQKEYLRKQAEQTYQAQYDAFRSNYKEEYQRTKQEIGFPCNNKFESITLGGIDYYIWTDRETFKMLEHPHFFPALVESFLTPNRQIVQPDYSLDFSKYNSGEPKQLTLPLSDVKKFYTSGNVTSVTRLTGGDSSFSATGAIIGGLIAGPIGSILAGVTTNPYRLETQTTDTRKLFLRLGDETFELPYKDLEALKKIIPDKYVE